MPPARLSEPVQAAERAAISSRTRAYDMLAPPQLLPQLLLMTLCAGSQPGTTHSTGHVAACIGQEAREEDSGEGSLKQFNLSHSINGALYHDVILACSPEPRGTFNWCRLRHLRILVMP